MKFERTLAGIMKAHKEHQLRAELAHQKKLLAKNLKHMPCHHLTEVYQTRIHLLSWVLEDSTTF